jgi:hypothetical protein
MMLDARASYFCCPGGRLVLDRESLRIYRIRLLAGFLLLEEERKHEL